MAVTFTTAKVESISVIDTLTALRQAGTKNLFIRTSTSRKETPHAWFPFGPRRSVHHVGPVCRCRCPTASTLSDEQPDAYLQDKTERRQPRAWGPNQRLKSVASQAFRRVSRKRPRSKYPFGFWRLNREIEPIVLVQLTCEVMSVCVSPQVSVH